MGMPSRGRNTVALTDIYAKPRARTMEAPRGTVVCSWQSKRTSPNFRSGNGRPSSEVPKRVARSVQRPRCIVIDRKFSDQIWAQVSPDLAP